MDLEARRCCETYDPIIWAKSFDPEAISGATPFDLDEREVPPIEIVSLVFILGCVGLDLGCLKPIFAELP